jgi:molecular chaperone HscB
MPADFLMQQMELREALDEAKDASRLDSLREQLRRSRSSLEKEIAEAIDERKDYPAATDLVRKLQFLQRLDEEIEAAYEAIE